MKTSELFAAGGGGVPYASGVPHWWTIPNGLTATAGAAGEDMLQAFVPRADVTIDKVAWLRASASAADVYVGVYDKTGALLSDCAVDSDTTVTTHEVSTTAVNLLQGELYFWCMNQSAGVACFDATAAGDNEVLDRMLKNYIPDLSNMGTLPTSGWQLGGMWSNARANAALLSSITLSNFDTYNRIAMTGVTPA